MKQYIWLLAILIISACSTPVEEENAIPTDLNGLQAHLKMKKADLRTLQDEIKDIEGLISEKDPSFGEIKKFVTVEPIAITDFDHFVTVQGSVVADDLLSASSEMGGRITRLLVSEGDYVKQGQLIAETDLESIDKQVAELSKSLELAVDMYERQKRLWDQKIGSEVQFLQAKNTKERLEKSIETLQHQKTKSNVYAPISGAIDMVMLKEGEMSSPGMPIVQILNTSRLKIEADAPENLLGSVRRGDAVTVYLPALDEEMSRRITQLGRRIDPSNRTFKIEVAIPSKGILKPNLLAEIKLRDFSQKAVVSIPLELVQQEISGKNYVVVLGEDEEGYFAHKKYVSTGNSSEGQIVIEDGLVEGDKLITLGGRGLTEGERIKVAETTEES